MKENWVYRRGDLYLANLGVPAGSKQGGVRPVVVLRIQLGYYIPEQAEKRGRIRPSHGLWTNAGRR